MNLSGQPADLQSEAKAALEQVTEEYGEGWRIPSENPDNPRKTDVLVKVGEQRLELGNPDIARLQRTYVLFTDKPADHWLTPVFSNIAARLRADKDWRCFERPFVHYPVLDQPDGVERDTELLQELVE